MQVLEPEAALVTKPTPVDGIDVDALVAQHLVARGIDRDAATDRAMRAGALDHFQIPGAGPEPVRGGGEGPHRADLHGVAREV